MQTYHDWRDAFKTQKQELTLNHLEINGQIPTWLKGAFISTGPGDYEIKGQHANHWFDGYAILKGFYFEDSKVSFKNRHLLSDVYLKNEFLTKTRNFDHPQSDYIQQRLKAIEKEQVEFDNGNVSVAQLGDEAIAMTEVVPKVTFDKETLHTKGHLNYSANFMSHSELAHPCIDPLTHNRINVAIEYGKTTVYRIYRFDTQNRQKVLLAEYHSEIPFYMHSFCVTENYFVLLQSPLILDFSNPDVAFEEMLKYHDHAPSQFIVIHRDSKKVTHIPTDAFVCFHQANAYDVENTLTLDLCCYQAKEAYDILYFDKLMQKAKEAPTYLNRFEINVENQTIIKNKIHDFSCDFPKVNEKGFAGKPYQYLYSCRLSTEGNFIDGLLKADMKTKKTNIFEKPNCYFGEPVFVSNPNASQEDDGVILSLGYDASSHQSFVTVLNAEDFEVMAQAYLPTFMPFGLHGDFFA